MVFGISKIHTNADFTFSNNNSLCQVLIGKFPYFFLLSLIIIVCITSNTYLCTKHIISLLLSSIQSFELYPIHLTHLWTALLKYFISPQITSTEVPYSNWQTSLLDCLILSQSSPYPIVHQEDKDVHLFHR